MEDRAETPMAGPARQTSDPVMAGPAPAAPSTIPAPIQTIPAEPLPAAAASAAAGTTPVSSDIPQYYLPLRGTTPAGGQLVYQAGVLAAATVSFVNKASGVSTSTRIRRMAPTPESALAIDWEKASSYRSWQGDFSDWAFRTQTLEVLKSPGYRLVSNPGETEEDFRSRLAAVVGNASDEAAAKIQKQYETKRAAVERQAARAKQAVEREAEQSRGRKMQTAISLGATVLGALVGRKRISTGTLGRATTTMRDVGRSIDESGDVRRAEATLKVAQQELADLDAKLQADLETLRTTMDPQNEVLEKILLRPRRSDITVDAVGLVWMPHWRDASGTLTGAWE